MKVMDVVEPEILRSKYPAKEHARKVARYIIENGGKKTGVIYLEAQKLRYNEDNDQEACFRQRRYFFYLSGCPLPECYVTYDMAVDHLTLYIPPINPEDVIWSGLPLSPQEALEKFDVDEVLTADEVSPALAESKYQKATVYAIGHQVSDHITFLNFADKDMTLLKTAIETCRVTKSPYEVALIAHANRVSAAAHIAAMRAAATGAASERDLDAVFAKECTVRGCREQAYHSIVAGGTAAATLHYVRNDAPLAGKLLVLLDAGAEARCYAADITRTFPLPPPGHAGGPVKFAPTARAVYDIVLQMQTECLGMLRAGVVWDRVHEHAHRVAIAGLLKLGVLRGGDVDEILSARTSVAFFPHGLGHYLGMDTHDTGGNADYKDKDPMFRYLRVRGALPAGCVITVEPGVYFCRFIIEPYLKDPAHSRFIDAAVLDKYWDVGGVRIEDDVLVTEEGHENLTPVPKTVEEIERIMS